MPGPALVVATRYTSSPVGAYLELALSIPARLGMRLGWCMVCAVTDRQDARIGGRLNWGFPTEMGQLRWCSDGDERELAWEDRGLVVRGRGRGMQVPMALPARSLQQRDDGPVVVPGRLWGRFQRARIEVEVEPGDQLAWLNGPHRGVLVSGLNHVVREARHPIGLTATLQAPSRAPEAALCESWRFDDRYPRAS